MGIYGKQVHETDDQPLECRSPKESSATSVRHDHAGLLQLDICIMSVAGCNVCEIVVAADWTLLHLKAAVALETGIAIEAVRLLRGPVELIDDTKDLTHLLDFAENVISLTLVNQPARSEEL